MKPLLETMANHLVHQLCEMYYPTMVQTWPNPLEVQSGGGTTLVRRQSSLEDNETSDASDTLEAELTKADELRKEMKTATAGTAGDERISDEERNWHWQELSNSSNGSSSGANGTGGSVQEKGNGTERNVTLELFNSSNITQPREDRSWLRGSPWNSGALCPWHVSSAGKMPSRLMVDLGPC